MSYVIYLAGGETWYDTFRTYEIRNQLYSYYYLRPMKQRRLETMLSAMHDMKSEARKRGTPCRFFLDSGGFTYINHQGAKPEPRTFFADYRAFVRDTAELWDYVAELDIEDSGRENDVGVPLGLVEAWRETLHDEANGLTNVVPVWHDWRGVESWEALCADPRWQRLAIGSGLGLGVKNRLCHKAHAAGKTVHGLAETKLLTEGRSLRVDAVDSSTWLRATRWGGMYIFHQNRFRVIDHLHKSDRKNFKHYFKAIGVDYDKLMADDQTELTKASMIAWRNLVARYEEIYERRKAGIADVAPSAWSAGLKRDVGASLRDSFGEQRSPGKLRETK